MEVDYDAYSRIFPRIQLGFKNCPAAMAELTGSWSAWLSSSSLYSAD
jgi:hypothetical protein